jgi:hypothetical protein
MTHTLGFFIAWTMNTSSHAPMNTDAITGHKFALGFIKLVFFFLAESRPLLCKPVRLITYILAKLRLDPLVLDMRSDDHGRLFAGAISSAGPGGLAV